MVDADSVARVIEEAAEAIPADAVWVQTSTVGRDGIARLAADQPLEGLGLQIQEVRDLQRLGELGEGDPEGSPGERRVVVRGPGGAGNCQGASFRNNAV